MPFFLRVGRNGKATVCETNSSSPGVDGPVHKAKIWLDGDVICLHFPSIDNIRFADRAPLQIVGHMLRLPANETGMATAEAVLFIRRQMLQEGNESLLLAFAERGSDSSSILELYKEMLP